MHYCKTSFTIAHVASTWNMVIVGVYVLLLFAVVDVRVVRYLCTCTETNTTWFSDLLHILTGTLLSGKVVNEYKFAFVTPAGASL